jgi:hypothetical protein
MIPSIVHTHSVPVRNGIVGQFICSPINFLLRYPPFNHHHAILYPLPHLADTLRLQTSAPDGDGPTRSSRHATPGMAGPAEFV